MSRPQKIDPKIVGNKQDLGIYNLSSKDFILYALGIGFSTDPNNTNDFKYTYERHKDFTTFPTIASCLGQQIAIDKLIVNQSLLPKFPIYSILHAEERLQMVHKSIKIGANYKVETQTIDVIDRGLGKGAIIVNRISGYLINEKGQRDLAYYVDNSTLAKDIGGSGVKSTGRIKPIAPIPKRSPDLIIHDKTFANQAILYRLTSDPHPLHIDPEVAKIAKFPKPIIHGLATYGIVVRSIVQNLLQNDAEKVKSIEIRFMGVVYPGESFQIKIWKEAGRIFFDAEVVERKAKAVVGALGLRQSAKL